MNKVWTIPVAAIFATGVVCLAEPQPSEVQRSSTEALAQARVYKFQFRAGQNDTAPKAVALLEAAARKDPRNVELLNELGAAYFVQLSAWRNGGGDASAIGPLVRNALDAYERAVCIDPTNPHALAGRGMARIIHSGRGGSISDLQSGIADLNRGAELAPSNIPVRLMRAFTSLGLPSNVRSTATTEEDLRFLMSVAAGTQAADVLGVLLGDLYVEEGKGTAARREYEEAAKRVSFGGVLARSRLDSLATGDALASDISKLRLSIGQQCTMCHGS